MASKGVAPKVPVALPKGSEGPGSASAGTAASSNALVSVDNALSGAIGARIKVTTTTSTIEGTLYTADPLTSLLILNTSPTSSGASITPTSISAPAGTYRIIPLSQIQSFQLLSPAPSPSDLPSQQQSQQLDTPALHHRLATAITTTRTALARQGPKGTPPHAQALYDALARTHPARWEGTTMVISDCFAVEKPYLAGSVGYYGEEGKQNGAGGGEKGFKGDLERFRKVVQMEIEKASLRLGGGVSGMRATVVETRKGG